MKEPISNDCKEDSKRFIKCYKEFITKLYGLEGGKKKEAFSDITINRIKKVCKDYQGTDYDIDIFVKYIVKKRNEPPKVMYKNHRSMNLVNECGFIFPKETKSIEIVAFPVRYEHVSNNDSNVKVIKGEERVFDINISVGDPEKKYVHQKTVTGQMFTIKDMANFSKILKFRDTKPDLVDDEITL